VRLLLAAPFLSVSLLACAPAHDPLASPRFAPLATSRDVTAHDEYHYAPVVRVGSLVVVSGVAAARGETDEAKLRTMFDRARLELEAAGARMEDVVEISTFHVAKTQPDLEAAFEAFKAVHGEYFKPPYPAWTAIGNAVLLAPGAIAEMRLVAVIGSGQKAQLGPRPAP
jgi:enamine deaminase RidA (YjgF/YER057c/UK114 family)